nr:hypothetical protein [Tanacetum cinerariifolium]
RENATLKKKLAEKEMQLVIARMDHASVERRLHESIGWNQRFYMEMFRKGAVPKPSSKDESTERPRKKSKKPSSDGTEGPSELRGPPKPMVPKAGDAGTSGVETGGAGTGAAEADGAEAGSAGPAMPEITGDCKEKDKVKFVTATLQEVGTRIVQLKAKRTDIDGYTNPFHELALLCPRMVEPEQVKVEQYIRDLSKNIRGDVTSSRPAGSDEAVRMAYQLMGQIIQDKTDEAPKGEKWKGEGDRGGRGDNRRECLDRKDVTCCNCNEKGHLKRHCPKLKKNGQGGKNCGAVYKLEAVDA